MVRNVVGVTIMLLVSICIPSYNRLEKVKKNITSILQARSQDFEVVVVDNASDDNVYDVLSFDDSRLRIIRREKNIGGINCLKCLSEAQGKYILYCLDKDFIDGNFLDDFLEVVRNNLQLVGGWCSRDKAQYSGNAKIYAVGEKIDFFYTTRHPSGGVFLNRLIQEEIKLSTDEIKQFPFFLDLFRARCASEGPMLDYDRPLFRFETREEAAATISHTHFDTKEEDKYFHPRSLLKELRIMWKYIARLGISKQLCYRIERQMIESYYNLTVLGFQITMHDEMICHHYGVKTRCVSFGEQWLDVVCLSKQVISLSGFRYISLLLKYNYRFLKRSFCIHSKKRELRIKEFLERYHTIYLYGAGIGARFVASYFMDRNWPFAGFVVTRDVNNDEMLFGKPIWSLQTKSFDHLRDGIVVTVGKDLQPEILTNLKKRGYMDNVYVQEFFETSIYE